MFDGFGKIKKESEIPAKQQWSEFGTFVYNGGAVLCSVVSFAGAFELADVINN